MATEEKKLLKLPETISVRTLASLIGQDPTAVIGKLISNGVMTNINQNIDFDTAALLVEEFGFTAEAEAPTRQTLTKTATGKTAVGRPPVVTIMGHVDHGKTSLLDYIRSSNIAKGESGGITQHISAYQIEFTTQDHAKRKITFIDTPGHEAFSALRAHGASITDLVILVVAADDGVKPQTLEAIEHAKTANVPIIVAINKTDLPGSNPERVKQQLAEHELISEEWGGKTVMVPISAKTGAGVDQLLELIVLTTDLLELKADPDATAEGIVIEANSDKQVGSLATVLIYNGTLRTGQVIVVGKTFGRIRSMSDDLGHKLAAAGPAKPAIITGLKDVPKFGDRVESVPNEKVAKSMTQQKTVKTGSGGGGDANHFPILLKADVGGSLAALEDSIGKLKYKDAHVSVIASGIGQISENDIAVAKSAGAVIITFRSSPPKRIVELASKDGVDIKEYWVIYEAIEYLTEQLKSIATPTYTTTELGRLKILEVFSQKDGIAIVGGEVTQGVAKKTEKLTAWRDKEEIGEAVITGLRLGKVEVDQVEAGQQCGLALEKAPILEKGDILAFTSVKEEK